jgi:signal transduction histidine kinase
MLKRLVACGIILVTGLGVTIPNVLFFEGGDLAALAASVLGIVLGLAIMAAGVLLYRSDISSSHMLRVSGWNVLGVVVLGLVLLLATQYPGVALPLAVVASVVGVSAVAHILIGVTDVRRIRVGELARERQRLAVLNRLARHNLRNQAQVLTSAGEVVREHTSDDTGAEAAQRVVDGATRIATINEKLKRFQEATENLTAGESRGVATLVDDIVHSYRDSYPDAEIAVDIVDGGSTPVSTQFRSALDELLENAFEHGEAGERGVTIRVASEGSGVAVTVEDDGPGIPQQEWDVVSGELEQSQLRHASGLGLWVVKAVVESANGELRLNEDGTAITLVLPPE